MRNYEFTELPTWTASLPEVAEVSQSSTFYCMNCLRKRSATWITPNFGPLCRECVEEMKKGLSDD